MNEPAGAPVPSPAPVPAPVPALWDIAWTFNRVALMSFGGGLSAWTHELVVRRRAWLTEEEFLSAATLCRLLPGAKLVEQKLGDRFGVSRTIVRQALFRLSQLKLVRLEPARGAFVAEPSIEEAREVFAVRRMVEGQMVRQLIARRFSENTKHAPTIGAIQRFIDIRRTPTCDRH